MGRIIAWALVIFGSLRVGTGYYVASSLEYPESFAAASARYFGTKTSGEVIDQGLILIAVGVAFGLFARIVSKRD